ncbi:MAG: ligand-gated channel protein [Myxococcales bacterium]|nr:ligand-gated channel protein [Myxococcales bacterium]
MRALAFLFTLALVTLALSRPALADSREEARQAFAAGQAADKAKDYRTAIEHYLRAYELAPHHFALYNIATDYERLGELREAAEWFNRYVKEAPPSPELDRVQGLIVTLKLRPAKLTVTTRPVGARVFIDGQYSGRTPFAKPVKGGGRRVAVELDGQRDERDVFLEFGEPKTIEFTLRTVEPPSGATGTLEVTGQPVGASVAVDDQVVGVLPTTRVNVIPGEHTIKVTSFGYTPYETSTTVLVNEVTTIPIVMVREGQLAPDGPNTIAAGYLLGLGAGVDLIGNGGIVLFDFGLRFGQYDGALRVGKAAGLTSVDLLVRVALWKARFSPYIGAGYSYISSKDSSGNGAGGSGGEFVGGLRVDLSRSVTGSTSLIIESGFRYHPDIKTLVPGTAETYTTRTGIIIPLMASFQYTYGRQR